MRKLENGSSREVGRASGGEEFGKEDLGADILKDDATKRDARVLNARGDLRADTIGVPPAD